MLGPDFGADVESYTRHETLTTTKRILHVAMYVNTLSSAPNRPTQNDFPRDGVI